MHRWWFQEPDFSGQTSDKCSLVWKLAFGFCAITLFREKFMQYGTANNELSFPV